MSSADRENERRRRLIGAGVQIMGTGGVQAVNVRAVCREAKVSERHFYQAFDTKQDFVVAVYNDVIDDAFGLLATAKGGRDRRATLRELVGMWIDFVTADPRRGRIIAVEAAANNALAHRGREVASTLLQHFLDHTEGSRPSPTAANAVSREVAATILVAGVWGLLLAWLNDGLVVQIGREELIDNVVDLCLRALPRSGGAGDEGSGVAGGS